MKKPEPDSFRVVGNNLVLLLLLAVLTINQIGLFWLGFPVVLLRTVAGAFRAYSSNESVLPHVLSALLVLIIGLGTCGITGDIHGRPFF